MLILRTRARDSLTSRAKMAWDAVDRKPNIEELTRPAIAPISVARKEVSSKSIRPEDNVDLVEEDSIHESTRSVYHTL